MSSFERLDLSRVRTVSIRGAGRKVSVEEFGGPLREGMTVAEFLEGLPKVLGARDLLEVASAIARASREGRKVIIGMGAHPIKVGVSPLLIELMQRRILSALATNGASMVHDVEIAMVGRTSEDVAEGLKEGAFGVTEETALFINRALRRGLAKDKGAGEALGEAIWEEGLRWREASLFAMAYRLKVPLSVHIAVGTDVIHTHPSTDGAVLGEMSHRDFRLFARQVADLEGGVYINLGSAVLMPEVFLKALNLARNLGHRVEDFTAVDMDFIAHYRPQQNVLLRPGGKAFALRGHHEVMFPLLVAAVLEALTEGK